MLHFYHKMRQSWAGSAVSVTSSRRERRDCPGGPVIKTPHFQCREHGGIPGWGAKIPRAIRQKKKKEKEKKEMFKAISPLFFEDPHPIRLHEPCLGNTHFARTLAPFPEDSVLAKCFIYVILSNWYSGYIIPQFLKRGSYGLGSLTVNCSSTLS